MLAKQRLGHISKQGSSLLRFLLVEAAQAAARIHPDFMTSLRTPGLHASAQEHCQGEKGDGASDGDSAVLMWAKWL